MTALTGTATPALPRTRPADPIAALVTVPVTVIATAANLFAAVVAPLFGSTPGAPAESPLLWTVLAYVRRQFGNDTPTIRPTVSAPDVLGNIAISLPTTDADGDPLRYYATGGTKGSVALNADGHTFTYTPRAGQTGTDTVTVTVDDSTNPHIHGISGLINALTFGLLGTPGHSATATVQVVLNTPPSLTLSAGTPDASTGAVTVTVRSVDPDGNPLTFAVNPPVGGKATVTSPTLVDAATGTYTLVYTPTGATRHQAAAVTATTADKSDSVTVEVTDGHGATLSRSVVVAVVGANAVPQYTPTLFTTDAVTGKVTGTLTFTDGDGDALTVTGGGPTPKGAVVVNSDGTFTYTPTDIARNGAAITDGSDFDAFTVTVNDGHGASIVQSISVDLSPRAATTPASTMAAARAVLTDVLAERSAATASARASLVVFTSGQTSIDTEVLLVEVERNLRDINAADQRGDKITGEIERARLEKRLNRTVSDDELTILLRKYAAIDASETGLLSPAYAYLDAQAAAFAKPAPTVVNPFNYAPVLSRIVTITDPDTGVITGRAVYVDREGQPLKYFVGIVRVPGFDAGFTLDPASGTFVHTPTSPPSVARPATLQIDVRGTDTQGTFTSASGKIDYTAKVNVILGPGAGASAGKTVSVPAQRTLEQLDAEIDRQAALFLQSQASDAMVADTVASIASLAEAR
ncbi:hypothetical protein MARA_07450 [Mycolicibacterium arabiense]|uniref:Tandem-95 repeat protein n=1 Tax=Mycolicibacterium arabiense TaxID=1286181 RepID=A0A7I7RRZ2_9MYCO|nr:hypothetical protein MARA_07450 [Mycolicibacterium arabiense]